MLNEVIEALEINNKKIIVDATAGGGGHTAQIAETAKTVIAIDKDPDAVAVLQNRFRDRDNVHIVNNDFINIKDILKSYSLTNVDGILLDLGVSSYQLDFDERGFSYHKDAPLDMRMTKTGISAADVVNEYSEEELRNILFKYGEEKYAKSIAANIVKERQISPIETTYRLVDIIKKSMPASEMRNKHPARRTFQAIRIEVNSELDNLNTILDKSIEVLGSGGILTVITFHSLEDRMVKAKFAEWIQGCTCPKEFPVCICGKKPRGTLPFKFKKPTEEEIETNPRARSATLRVFKKF